eukprot:m.142946 g.142946  ORF g.142946 m.142946 type:complete len:57 (-) comp14075_c0_seq1:1210-1380(-)
MRFPAAFMVFSSCIGTLKHLSCLCLSRSPILSAHLEYHQTYAPKLLLCTPSFMSII